MVFFTCNHCGESVKKPAVEKHYNTKCRGANKNVSCMDCLKDFRGEEYVAHTKCITEAEKYSGKDYVHKESKNSGAKKQESWMDIIRSILDSSDYKLSGQARSAFQRLQSVDNVPRKKAKFQNFVANCMRMPRSLSEEVWSVLEKEQEKMKQARQQESQSNGTKAEANGKVENGVKEEVKAEDIEEEDEPVKKKSKKDKMGKTNGIAEEQNGNADREEKKKAKKQKLNGEAEEDNPEEPSKKKAKKEKSTENGHAEKAAEESVLNETGEDEEAFQWSAVLEKIVGKHADGIALEKLKKRLLKKYQAKLGIEELSEKQQKKFDKKFAKNLKKCASISVEAEIAKPC